MNELSAIGSFLAVKLNEQAVDYTKRRFSSGKALNEQAVDYYGLAVA